jgi:hypothetical protein
MENNVTAYIKNYKFDLLYATNGDLLPAEYEQSPLRKSELINCIEHMFNS